MLCIFMKEVQVMVTCDRISLSAGSEWGLRHMSSVMKQAHS